MATDLPARRPRRWPFVLALVVGLVGAAVYLVATALSVRSHLTAARGGLATVRADITDGKVDAALAGLKTVSAEAAVAHDRAHGPLWWLAAHVPLAGRPVATTQAIADAAYDVTAHALPPLARQADHLRPSKLRPKPDTIDLSQLVAAAPALTTAAADLSRDERRVADTKPSWIGVVADARSQMLKQLRDLAGTSAAAARVAQLAPPMLGASGPRRYFVGFQNTAESRGTGGLIGGYAIVTADQGRLHVDKLASDAEFPPVKHPATGLDPEFVRRYHVLGADSLWVNTNLSPNFPDAAAVWASLWRQATGQRIDGAVAMDPTALAAIIGVTGPVGVPGLGKVGADRVVPLIGAEQYRLYPTLAPADVDQRKKVVLGVAGGAIDALLAGRGDAQTLFRALGKAAGQGHLLLASEQPSEEAGLIAGGVAGALPDTHEPFAYVSFFNSAGSKLDYYLDGATDYHVDSCSGNQRTVTITVRLHNGAPLNLPEYVTVRTDNPAYPTKPGDNRLFVQVYATDGAVLRSATLDGQAMTVQPTEGVTPAQPSLEGPGGLLGADADHGHPVFWTDVEIKRGATRTLALSLSELVGRGAPIMPVQDSARPWRASADLSGCA